jgi:capsule polysaccharide export protein KpsC/LpsZ
LQSNIIFAAFLLASGLFFLGKTLYFRNASSLSKYNKIVDIPLKEYLKRVRGLVILRI